MASTLSINADLIGFEKAALPSIDSAILAGTSSTNSAFNSLRLNLDSDGKSYQYWYFFVFVILLHIFAALGYINRDTSTTFTPKKHAVSIEFIKPEVIPPPPIEPPKPPPTPPKVQKVVTPPPQPALRTPVADDVIKPSDIVVQENTQAPVTTAPVEAATEPTPPVAAPPAPVVEEPITEATASAGYLNNPKPEYPSAALRQGWGGTVILRVRVLADGKAESVQVKKSSGRKVLDESAISAVKNWTFVPSKRGSTAIDGWATVPIVFNPEQ